MDHAGQDQFSPAQPDTLVEAVPATPDPSHVWLPELVQRFASFLPANDVACTFRLVNRATADQFRDGPRHTTVRLSQPVPPHEFSRKWISPAHAMHPLTCTQRRRFLRSTAASGVLGNLQALLDAWPDHFQLREELFLDAAAGGSVEVFEFLKARGCQCPPRVLRDGLEKAIEHKHETMALWLLEAGADVSGMAHGSRLRSAAGAGMEQLCQRLLAHQDSDRFTSVHNAAGHAARGGFARLTDQLLTQLSQPEREALLKRPGEILAGAAQGLDLPTLQRLYLEWVDRPTAAKEAAREAARGGASNEGSGGVDSGGRGSDNGDSSDEVGDVTLYYSGVILGSAAASTTADWADKVAWLERARGYHPSATACLVAANAAPHGIAVERLQWLVKERRGYSLSQAMVGTSMVNGNVGLLRFLLDEGMEVPRGSSPTWVDKAVTYGNLEMLKLLQSAGMQDAAHTNNVLLGAGRGDTAMVQYLVGTLGLDLNTTTSWSKALMMERAAESGQLELVVWLHERGCPCTKEVFSAAVAHNALVGAISDSGGLALLEYLRDHGCPMEDDATTFAAAAATGCRARMAWLAEAGCSMGDAGQPYVAAACNGDLATLRFLREQLNCPWSADGSTFTRAVSRGNSHEWKALQERAMCWLLDNGCPVDWTAAEAALKPWQSASVVEWVQQQRQARAS